MAQRLWIVSYDVSCPKRWRRVFALMKRKGVHRQLSVFLVRTDAAGQRRLLADLSCLIDPTKDSLLMAPIDAAGGAIAELGLQGPTPGAPVLLI